MVSTRAGKPDVLVPGLPQIKGLPKSENILKGPTRIAKPPIGPRMETVFSRGPRWLQLANTPYVGSGHGEPPPGFVTSSTSRTEWIVYWALSKIYGNPQDPRKFPYLGGYPDWGYQVGLDGTRANAVVDFMINRPGQTRRLGLRIQTGYFHYGKGSAVIAFDQAQMAFLLTYIDVVDIPDTDVLGDPSGQKAIIRVRAALAAVTSSDPVTSGTVHRGG